MKTVRRRTAALALTVAVGVGIPLVVAPSAFADRSGDCYQDDVCLFDDSGYNGLMWSRDAYWNREVVTWNLGDAGFNDRTSSWINKGPHDARWFWGANASGGSECMNSKAFNSYVGWYNNDEASSVQIYTNEWAC